MSTQELPSEPTATEPEPAQLTRIAVLRCLLALLCSHVAAPYAAARLTIRFQLQGDSEPRFALIAGAAIATGALLSFRQLVGLSSATRWKCGLGGILLWLVVAFVLLAIAADSTIPAVVLGLLWAGGSFWIAWTAWAYSFFRSTGVLVGTLVVGVLALPFWTLVEATGILGNTRVEFAWRQPRPVITVNPESNQASVVGEVRWPGYLGENRDGVVTSAELDDWQAHPPQQLWMQSCGKGWSSFAVTSTTLYGQEQLASGDCVTARELGTGELLWTVSEERSGFVSGLGGDGPRATPTLHETRVDGAVRLVLYVVGPTGLVSCLDAETGEVFWQVDLMDEFPGQSLIHGVCGSPLIVDDLVIVAPPTDTGPGLVALHQHDGDVVWRCSSDWRASYASPALMTIAGKRQVVLHAGPGVMGVDPSDGSVLWQYEWTNEFDNNATQPLQLLDTPSDLLVATGYQGGVARISISTNDAGEFQVAEVWTNRKTMKTKFCGMAQFGDVVVGLDNSILCAVDINTGKRRWKKGRYGFGQLLQIGEYLLVVEERGRICLLRPDSESHNPVGDAVEALSRKTWSHPVLVDDHLIVRNDQQIACLQLPLLQPAADSSEEQPADGSESDER